MSSTMATKKNAADEPEEQPPSGRAALKYIAIPVPLWEDLKAWADSDERSVNWAARKLISEGLERHREK